MIRKGHLAWGRSAVSHERYRPGFSGPPKRTVLALLRSLPELEAGSSLNLETREIPLLSQLARMQAEAKLFFEPTPNSFDYRFFSSRTLEAPMVCIAARDNPTHLHTLYLQGGDLTANAFLAQRL